MKLATTIELHAGGPGSGCKGPNCGRPEGSGKGEDARTGSEKRFDTMVKGKPPIEQNPHATTPGTRFVTGPSLQNIEPAYKSSIAPEFNPDKRYVPPAIHDPADLAQHAKDAGKAFQQGQHPWTQQEMINKKVLEEKDKVVLTKDLKTISATPPFNEKIIPAGREVTFIKHDPPKYDAFVDKLQAPPTAQVRIGRSKTTETVPLNDIHLLEKSKENVAPIAQGEIRPSQIAQQYRAADGAIVTLVRPKLDPEDDTRTRQFWKLEHPLKNQFREASGLLRGLDDPKRVTQVFFAEPKNAEHAGVQFPTQNQPAKEGTTVFVERWEGKAKVVITEVKTGQYGYQASAYSRSYNNRRGADQFLDKRYSIQQELPRSFYQGGTVGRQGRRRR